MTYKWTIDRDHIDCFDCHTNRTGYEAFVTIYIQGSWLWVIVNPMLDLEIGVEPSQTEAMAAVVRKLDKLQPERNLWSRFWRKFLNHQS